MADTLGRDMRFVPRSSNVISVLLVAASCVTATTLGYDGSMMNALNILPSYTEYFSLNTTTLALNTSALWIGGAVAGIVYGPITDILGRKKALFWAAVLTIISAIIQAAAQNIAMFVVSRILIGFGTGASAVAGPTYLAETMQLKHRAWGLGVFYDCWFVGGLISAGVTYGTAKMDTTWAWRLPSALQGLFSIICIVILPFMPESPRWLVHKGYSDEALDVIALTYANGDRANPAVLVQYQEIVDTLNYEKNTGETLSVKQMFKTPSARKRTILSLSVAVITMLSGNNIISFYLGTMLENAGITDSHTQLEINIILNAWSLCIALFGTVFANRLGRKKLAAISTAALTVFLFMFGGLTAKYGTSANTAGIYGTVATLFLFQGSYSFGLSPITVMYPPEVLNYPIRSNGMGLYTFLVNGVGLLVTFAFPYALDAIGWKTYMINGAWNVLEVLFILFYWVETKDKTLEEIDALFEGEKHSDVVDLEIVLNGKLDASNVLQGIDVPIDSNEVPVTSKAVKGA